MDQQLSAVRSTTVFFFFFCWIIELYQLSWRNLGVIKPQGQNYTMQ